MLKVYLEEYWIHMLSIPILSFYLMEPGFVIGMMMLYIDHKGTNRKEFIRKQKIIIQKKEFDKSDKKYVPKILNKEYTAFLESQKWKAIRHRTIHRDGYKCCSCNSKKNLQVHHLTYGGIFEMNFQLNQLQTLCTDCHNKVHNR